MKCIGRIIFGVCLLWMVALRPTPLCSAQAPPPAGTKLKLFLLLGQSNMAGRGAVEVEDKVPDPRIFKLDASGHWVAAVDPIHFDKPGVVGVGPGRTFALRVADAEPDVMIGLIPCAVGGVSLDQWRPGGKLYQDAVRRATVALHDGQIAGILWHQGEADTKPTKIASYAERLDRLMNALRRDLHAPAAPLIVGELGLFGDPTKNAARAAFNTMIARYAADRPALVGLAKSDGLTNIGDNTHFDANSQRELGRRYADAFLKLSHSAAANKP